MSISRLPSTPASEVSRVVVENPGAWSDLPVRFLVLETLDFIVFLDDELDVDWKTSDAYDAKYEDGCNERGAILNRAAFLQAIPVEHLLAAQRLGFRRMLGEAVARALEGNIPDAGSMLEKAEEFVTLRNREHARLWYLSAGALAVLAVAIFTGILWFGHAAVAERVGEGLPDLALAATAGALGALLSISRRVGKLPLDPSAGRKLHMIEGAGHVVLGCIGAMIAWLALHSGIIVPELVAKSQGGSLSLLVCLVAGASERLVPSLVERFEVTFSGAQRPGNGSRSK